MVRNCDWPLKQVWATRRREANMSTRKQEADLSKDVDAQLPEAESLAKVRRGRIQKEALGGLTTLGAGGKPRGIVGQTVGAGEEVQKCNPRVVH